MLCPGAQSLNDGGSHPSLTPPPPPMCPQVYCCPYCSFLSPESDQVRAHALSQHAVQPKYRCPLCQEQLVGRPALHFHLSHLHNVVPECVEKLLLVVSTGCVRAHPGGPVRAGQEGRQRCWASVYIGGRALVKELALQRFESGL